VIIQLKKGKELSILRKHPWIFTGAIQNYKDMPMGTWVEVQDAKGKFLANGYSSGGSIALRLMNFEKPKSAKAVWNDNLYKAIQLRKALGLLEDKHNTAFRLVFAEADDCPGLIADYYQGYLVLQFHTLGAYQFKNEILDFFQQQKLISVLAILNKSANTLKEEGASNEVLFGDIPKDIQFIEDGQEQSVSLFEGQKTGTFLDQKENRLKIKQIAKDKKVLNLFSYTGGFSMAALMGGANKVESVDISAKAIDLCNQNIQKLGMANKHESFCMDVFEFLKEKPVDAEVIIVDPPAFAKSMSKRHNAIQAYARLNSEVFKKCKAGTEVFTFSCTQVVSEQQFMGAITSAAIQSGREIKVLSRLSQPIDHPISLYHPEGHYLKGLRLWVV
jgi:23S rRNA (cytosine1962-C5)-methyltransferase